MQNIIQALNEGKNMKSSVDFRENFNAVLDKRIGDLKKFFNEKKLIHHTTTENKKSRSGYIEISKIFRNYGFITQDFIEAYSSEEESDIEDEKINEPSVRQVNEKILDFRTIISVKKVSNIPKNARPGVVIMNLEEWVSIPILKRFIEEIPIFLEERVLPKISDIRIFKYKNINFGLVLLIDIELTKKIYSFFNHPQKLSINPAKNSKGEKIEVLYAFDLLDMENSEWYGVILRNIPEKCSHENLKNFIGSYSKHINYLLPSTKIKNSFCSIVVLDSFEEAEKICRCINKKEMGKNRFIKAHLHPRTCLMRRNPENSIFKNYYRFDNGEYYKKYKENNVGNILSSNGNINNLNTNTKYTPIYRILTNFFDSKLNNLQSGITNQPTSYNSNNAEFNNKTNEDLKNQRLQEKENPLNKKRLNTSIIKDNPIFLTNNNTFKKSTDFLNFCFDEEEKNKKKHSTDMNTSYLTKLIKPSGTSTNKNHEVKQNKDSNFAPTSTVNLFIADIEENNNIRDIKENKNKGKNVTGYVKRFEIEPNKNDIDKEINEGRIFNQQNSFEKENENALINYKKSLEVFNNNNQFESKNNQILANGIQEKTFLLSSNEEKVMKTKENKKELKQSGKRLEIGPVGKYVISELSNNPPTVQGDFNKASNSNITTNLASTPTTNINKNESIISNLSGILKEMVKSDKEKTLRNQNIETTDFNLSANFDKNQDKIIEIKTQSKTENLTIYNTNDNMEETDEEIIDLKFPSCDPEFFKYDFQEKSYFDKPKIYRIHSKINKEERSSYPHSKSIYDRSRDKDREKDRDKDKIHPYSKFNEKSSKKYSNNAEESNDQKNTYIDIGFNYYNVNSKLNTSSSSINNYQSNTSVNNQIKNSNTLNTNFNQNTTSLNKTRFSNFSSADKKNNSNDNNPKKDPKISNPRNLQINSNNPNESSNNFNVTFIQTNNHVKNNYAKNNNFVSNNQQHQIQNNNSTHQQFQTQNVNSTIFSNKPNISTQQSHNAYLPNKMSTGQQIPFNPIIQNNPTIINNFINLIPSLPTELAKDKNVNQNTNNNLNNIQYPNSHSGQPFNNLSFKSVVNPGNISNINVVYPTNPNLTNNLNFNQNMVVNQKNYSSIANITHNVLVQNIKMDDKISDIKYLTQNELNGSNIDSIKFIGKTNSNISVPQSSDFEKLIENKNEIILPPSDDFIPPLPPENPPEPDTMKFDELELSTFDKDCFYNKNKKLENIVEDRIRDDRPFIKSINQMISSNYLEKTEPGQILNYDSEDGSLTNLNSKKPSKRIDVKNAPINFKKYNCSRSSSSSSHSYRKKDYINKKRDREKIRKYSRERERDKDKDKRKKKYRSRSKENSTNNISNSINIEKISHSSSSKRDNRDYKDYMSRNAASQKYHDGNKKYNKQENRSSSSSSSFQSGEEGRYYKRFLERRINTKKEKK